MILPPNDMWKLVSGTTELPLSPRHSRTTEGTFLKTCGDFQLEYSEDAGGEAYEGTKWLSLVVVPCCPWNVLGQNIVSRLALLVRDPEIVQIALGSSIWHAAKILGCLSLSFDWNTPINTAFNMKMQWNLPHRHAGATHWREIGACERRSEAVEADTSHGGCKNYDDEWFSWWVRERSVDEFQGTAFYHMHTNESRVSLSAS